MLGAGQTLPVNLGLGSHTITLTVTDPSGASSQDTVIINVVDTTLPQVTVPASASYQCLSQVPPGNPSQATATDNCSATTITVADASNGGAGSIASPLVITRVFTATDAAGNSANAAQTITVIDNTAPTVTACATNKTLTANANNQAVIPNLTGEVSALDNCAPASALILTQSPPAGTLVGLGATTVTITVSDTAGNSSTCAATVTVKAPPVSADFFLHGDGPDNNPPTLFLNPTAPATSNAKFKDSLSLNRNGGNPWKEVGGWTAAPSLTAGTLTALSDLRVWLGLKNSDDQGTYFDLRVEVSKNGALVAAGETYCIQGVTRNPNLAKEVIVSFAPFSPVTFNGATDGLALKVLTRIGSDGAGGACGGHSNAVGLRLYFDSVGRPSRFNTTIAP